MLYTQRSGPRHHAKAAPIEYYEQGSATQPRDPWLTPYELGWRDGYAAAVTLIAERADALDASWRPPNRRTQAELRRERFDSLEPEEGLAAWGEAMRQQSLKSLGFVWSADRMTPALEAAGITVSPLAACDWPPVAVPGKRAAA